MKIVLYTTTKKAREDSLNLTNEGHSRSEIREGRSPNDRSKAKVNRGGKHGFPDCMPFLHAETAEVFCSGTPGGTKVESRGLIVECWSESGRGNQDGGAKDGQQKTDGGGPEGAKRGKGRGQNDGVKII